MRTRRAVTAVGAAVLTTACVAIVAPSTAARGVGPGAAFHFTSKQTFVVYGAEPKYRPSFARFAWTVRHAPRGARIELQRTTRGKYSRTPSRFRDFRTLRKHVGPGTVRGKGKTRAPAQGHYRYRIAVRSHAGSTKAVSAQHNIYSYFEDHYLKDLIGTQADYIIRLGSEDADFPNRFPANGATGSHTGTTTYHHTTCNRIVLGGGKDPYAQPPGKDGPAVIRVRQGSRTVTTLRVSETGRSYFAPLGRLNSGTLTFNFDNTGSPIYYDGLIRCWTPNGRSVA